MLRNYRKEIDYCTYCPKLCRFACPVGNAKANETAIPWGRQTLLYLYLEGRQELTPEIAETFYQCAYCMMCREFCDHDNVIPPIMREARALALEKGLAPESVTQFKAFFEKRRNPTGEDLQKRVRDLVPEQYLNPDAQVAYFPGCAAVYSFPQNITDTLRIFEAIGVDYVAVWDGAQQCCGEPIDTLGFAKEHKAYIADLHKRLRGYKQIISGCPACVHNLRTRFAEEGYPLTTKIFHISEFLAPFFKEGKVPLGRLFELPTIYHDPCYLGRYLGVYDAPRAILQQVCSEPVQEFSWNREHSYCCGGGGGIGVSDRDTVSKIVNERLREYYESRGKVLVSACPTCERTFQREGDDVNVMDLVNIVARALAR